GKIKLRASRNTAIAGVAIGTIAGHGLNDASYDLTDRSVVCVGDENVARTIDKNAVRIVELRAGRRPAIAGVSCVSVAGDRGDVAVRRYLTNHRIVGVCDEDVSRGIHEHAFRMVERCTSGRSAVTGIANSSVPSRNRERPGRVDFEDMTRVGVRDVRVTGRVQCDSARVPDAGLAR